MQLQKMLLGRNEEEMLANIGSNADMHREGHQDRHVRLSEDAQGLVVGLQNTVETLWTGFAVAKQECSFKFQELSSDVELLKGLIRSKNWEEGMSAVEKELREEHKGVNAMFENMVAHE